MALQGFPTLYTKARSTANKIKIPWPLQSRARSCKCSSSGRGKCRLPLLRALRCFRRTEQQVLAWSRFPRPRFPEFPGGTVAPRLKERQSASHRGLERGRPRLLRRLSQLALLWEGVRQGTERPRSSNAVARSRIALTRLQPLLPTLRRRRHHCRRRRLRDRR